LLTVDVLSMLNRSALTRFALLLSCAVACSQSKSGGDRSVTMMVGAAGGIVSIAGARVQIPSGALTQDTAIGVATLSPHDVAASEVMVNGAVIVTQLLSEPVAFTPHGTQFSSPVTIELPYSGGAELVMRLDDPHDTTWEVVDDATFEGGMATVVANHFSVYVVARVKASDVPNDGGDIGPIGGGPDGGGMAGGPGSTSSGEPVVETYDSRSRTYGDSQLLFDGTRFFWTRDKDGKLAIFSADVTGALPATATKIFEVPFAASPGWSNPRMLATTNHLVLPVIGVTDVGAGLVESDGWATLRKDGSNFKLDVMDGWWLVARGPAVVFPGVEGVVAINLDDGGTTPLENVPSGSHDTVCVYDAKGDQMGCLGYGIAAYDFKTAATIPVTQSLALKAPQFGSPRLAFNSTHWFAPVSLPSGGGIGAYARDGGGGVVFHEMVDALGAVLADDQHLFACLAGSLTRISLVDKTRTVLTRDCGNAQDVSLVGMDASYIYYVYADPASGSFPQTFSDTLSIYRVTKAR
jgi:hypothetical protein